jgi:hypothetical protein
MLISTYDLENRLHDVLVAMFFSIVSGFFFRLSNFFFCRQVTHFLSLAS